MCIKTYLGIVVALVLFVRLRLPTVSAKFGSLSKALIAKPATATASQLTIKFDENESSPPLVLNIGFNNADVDIAMVETHVTSGGIVCVNACVPVAELTPSILVIQDLDGHFLYENVKRPACLNGKLLVLGSNTLPMNNFDDVFNHFVVKRRNIMKLV